MLRSKRQKVGAKIFQEEQTAHTTRAARERKNLLWNILEKNNQFGFTRAQDAHGRRLRNEAVEIGSTKHMKTPHVKRILTLSYIENLLIRFMPHRI